MAILKRKVNGSWETVANPQDFPVKVPVEITEAPLQTYSGTFMTNGFTPVNVNCGFEPDMVDIYLETASQSGATYTTHFSFPFFDSPVRSVQSSAFNNGRFDYTYVVALSAHQTTTGFTVDAALEFDANWATSEFTGESLSFVAKKWT